MKIKRKGKKVHPSPPQTTATFTTPTSHDSLSVLSLLPAAILTLITVLSFQDREVLAYMITRSLQTTTTSSINSSSPSKQEELNLKLKKTNSFHKSPVFDCECFECYTSFWFRWDSSPNREVIHQAIEAFEEHLASGELEMKRSNSNRRGKKKDKDKAKQSASIPSVQNETLHHVPAEELLPKIVAEGENEVNPTAVVDEETEAEATVVIKVGATTADGHKGFARKVLPDVLGVFNSRLWNLWGPNV